MFFAKLDEHTREINSLKRQLKRLKLKDSILNKLVREIKTINLWQKRKK